VRRSSDCLQNFITKMQAQRARLTVGPNRIHHDQGLRPDDLRDQFEPRRSGLLERDARIGLMECLQPANDPRPQTIVSHQDVAETQNLCCWHRDSFIRVGDVVRAAAVQKEVPTSFGDVCEASGSTWFMGGEP
jgi:hypothetical protein